MGGGRIESASREWTVTTSGKVQRVEDFGTLIAAQRAGRPIYLRDVAVIEDGLAEESSIARFNGQRGVSLDVRRRSGANTVAVARAVRAELDALRSELPAGMEITLARDMAVFIEDSIEAIFVDMLWGCLLVVLVVLLFLRNTRSTLIAGLAIPSSLIASFTFFYLSGFTLNMMTLMALALSIGIVIDDAIVVLEVVYRRIEHGESAMEAAEKGSEQVMLAVLSTTLALCAVFVPIAFLEGSVGQWFYEFGIVMAIAVLVSMLFALTLTPMLASRILSVDQSRGRFFHLLDRGLNALDSFYAAVLRHAMRHRWLTLTATLAASLGGFALASTVPFDFFGMRDRGEFTVSVKLPVGTPLPVTDKVSRRMEDAVRPMPEIKNVFATVGEAGQRQPHIASLFIDAGPKGTRQRDPARAHGRGAPDGARGDPRGGGDRGERDPVGVGLELRLEEPDVQPAGSRPPAPRRPRRAPDGEDAGGSRPGRRRHLVRDRQARDRDHHRARRRGRARRAGGGDRPHHPHSARRRRGGLVRGGRRALRRAGPGATRVPRRSGAPRPDPRPRRSGRADSRSPTWRARTSAPARSRSSARTALAASWSTPTPLRASPCRP